jgi:hypothetical protein
MFNLLEDFLKMITPYTFQKNYIHGVHNTSFFNEHNFNNQIAFQHTLNKSIEVVIQICINVHISHLIKHTIQFT